MIIQITGIRVSLEENEASLANKAEEILLLPLGTLSSPTIIKKTLDARRHRPPFFLYTIEAALPDSTVLPEVRGNENITISLISESEAHCPGTNGVIESYAALSGPTIRKTSKKPTVAVVGSGPAGLFASLTLAAGGFPVLLLDRGKAVPERRDDVRSFWEKATLNRESNVHFGEGGAGTFSDGKLTSRARNPLARLVKETFVELGAPAEILTSAKPHIGTDRLQNILINFRKKLLDLGCEIRFGARLSDMEVRDGRITGITINESEEHPVNGLVLAMGQNADDTYRMLHDRGVMLAPKPFALGVRLEHPQRLINEIQYGKWHGHPALPPAEYVLTARATNLRPQRSVYTFCMCPGGRVIACSSEPGGIITNGMSGSARAGAYANSAVVVNVNPDDFATFPQDPLQGLLFRRQWEEKAFELGGENYFAPAQLLLDFLQDRDTGSLISNSYLPGVKAAPLREALPEFVGRALKEGLKEMGSKMSGFIGEEAILVGVETRTSAPVRILRGSDGQSVSREGLYPCGEGAGYAGGIISSALDGIKAAENLIRTLGGHR